MSGTIDGQAFRIPYGDPSPRNLSAPMGLSARSASQLASFDGEPGPQAILTQREIPGRRSGRTWVLTFQDAVPAGANVSLTFHPEGIADNFANPLAAPITQDFQWPDAASVILDTTPPEVERIAATIDAVEILFSEPIDSASLPAAVTVDGQNLTWTASGSEYRYRAEITLPPGPHQVQVSTDLRDLAGTAPPATTLYPFSIQGASGTIAYEKPDPKEIPASAAKNPYDFQGLPRDPETGFLYVRNRYYDPEIGSFITADPLGFVDGPSEYAFAGNSPANRRDSLGLLDDGYLMHDERQTISSFNASESERVKRLCEKDSLAEECQHFLAMALSVWLGDSSAELLPIAGSGIYSDAPLATSVNGVRNDRRGALEGAEALALTFGLRVGGVWNISYGLPRDSAQLLLNKIGVLDEPTRMLARAIRSRVVALPEGAYHVVFAHSQGAAIATSALSALTPEERGRILLVTFGEATYSVPDGLFRSVRISNTLDFVPLLLGGNWMRSSFYSRFVPKYTTERFFLGGIHTLSSYLESERSLEAKCQAVRQSFSREWPAICEAGVGRALISVSSSEGSAVPIIRAAP